MGEHTPGPWIQDRDNPRCVGTPKDNGGVYRIVTVLEGGEGYRNSFNAEQAANARLIASAPTLRSDLDEAVALLREVPGAASSQRYVEAWSERARAFLSRHDTPTDSEEEG